MDPQFTQHFISQWNKYFAPAGQPVCFFYTDQPGDEDLSATLVEERCLIGNLNRVRQGYPFVYQRSTPGCKGGKRYTGFIDKLRPNFVHFLSCGIPGVLEGERYKKSPALVEQYLNNHPPFEAPGKYLVFKRLDKLAAHEQPLAVIFFAAADALAGLFTLANYDWPDPHAVIAPMGSGCASIISYPYFETQTETPRCVLGMFDVSARPHLPPNLLTFTVPFKRFEQMARNMDESFLITASWQEVKSRLD